MIPGVRHGSLAAFWMPASLLLALWAGPAWAAPELPREFVQALAQHPLDPVLQLQLARALEAQPDRREEAMEILRGLIGAGAPAQVVDEARRLLITRLVAEPVHRAWEPLYRVALIGAPPFEAVTLRAHLAAIAGMGRGPSASQPHVKAGADPHAAWVAAPADAALARAWAEASVASGDLEGALVPLGVVLDAWPADRVVLGLHTRAAITAGKVDLAILRTRQAVAGAPDAKSRDALLGDLVALEMVAGEQQKAALAQDEALTSYLTALAVRPRSLDVVLGAAGLAWQSEDLEGAWALYNRALVLHPGHVDALLGAVTVGLSVGHDDEALRLIEAVSSRDPRVLTLRASVERANRAKDARAAARAGDAEAAAAAFQALLDSGPPEAEYFHGLADALSSLGHTEEAILAWRQALRLDPGDAWAVVGEANALVSLGRRQEARDRLAAGFPLTAPPGAEDERRRVLGRSWRLDAEAARALGDPVGALEAYRQALSAFPEVWACVGVGGLYLEDGQAQRALDFYDEALRLGPGEDAAVEGRALALEALGRPTEGLAVLDAQIAAMPSDASREARERLAPRVAVAQAMGKREAGDLAGAEKLLVDAITHSRASADLYAALSVVTLDQGNVNAAVRDAKAALAEDGSSAWARQVMIAAGRACRCTAKLMPALQAAVDAHAGDAALIDLEEARLDAAVQSALADHQAGRVGEAVATLREAEHLARTAQQLTRVGGAWLGISRGREAQAVFQRALALNPDDVDALIGRAGAMAMLSHLAAAVGALSRDFERLGDGRLGLALARLQQQRGQYPAATRTLARVQTPVVLPVPPAPVVTRVLLDAIPLPSGRAFTEPPPLPLAVPATLDLEGERDLVSRELARQRAPRATAGFGVVTRGGLPGWSGLTAVVTPIDTGPSPAGPIRLDIEVVPVHLDDVDGTDDGVTASLGFATPEALLLGITARAGISPIGFAGGVYPVWSARLVARLAPGLVLGVQTDRAPRADSRASWAGVVYPATGQLYGRVSEIDGRLYTSWTPPRADLGISARGGYVEGIGVTPNPFGEGVIWAGRTFPAGIVDIRAGADGIAIAYAQREDGFLPGEGGYFSPPLFLLGLARVDADLHADSVAVCAGAGVGPRYLAGDSTGFGSSGLALTGTGHVGVGVRLAPRWDLTLDGRGQVGTDGWHQFGGYARLAWGVPTTLPGAPALSTLAAPGLALPGDGQGCSP